MAKDQSFKVTAEGDFERIHLITCNILQTAINQSLPQSKIKVKSRCLDTLTGGLIFTFQIIWERKEIAPNVDMDHLARSKCICR